MRTARVLGIGLIVVGLMWALSGVFWNLDFYIGQAQTQMNSQVATSSNTEGRTGVNRFGGESLYVYVEGNNAFAEGLRDELRHQLAGGPLFANVRVNEQAGGAAANVLAVQLGRQQKSWSGVYSRAEIEMKMSFSTMGGVYYPGAGSTVRFNGENPGLVVQGTYTLNDSALGLMSLRGYEREVGRRAGAELAKSLTAELRRQAS